MNQGIFPRHKPFFWWTNFIISVAAAAMGPGFLLAAADIIKFVHQEKGLCLGKIHWLIIKVIIYFYINKCIQLIRVMIWKS